MNIKRYISLSVTLAILAGVAVAVPAFAATPTPGSPQGWSGHGGPGMGMRGGPMMRPSVIGTVSTVSGDTLTVSGRQGFGTSTPATTFTVDATNATVKKNNATSTVSSIAVGDMVAVQGTVSGTTITATSIRDGVMPMGGPGMMGGRGRKPGSGSATSTPPVMGNGEPIVAGTVSTISGSTISITNKSNVVYTVDASTAKILEGQSTVALSSINTGDSLLVQGTINGTSVTASTIIDQTRPAGSATTTPAKPHPGFFGGIGQFFMHLFGF